jgi:hypothetical protein
MYSKRGKKPAHVLLPDSSQYTGSLHVYMSFLKHQPCQPASALSSYGSFRVLGASCWGCTPNTFHCCRCRRLCGDPVYCEEDGTPRQPGSGDIMPTCYGALSRNRQVALAREARSPFRRFWTQPQVRPSMSGMVENSTPPCVEVFSFSNGREYVEYSVWTLWRSLSQLAKNIVSGMGERQCLTFVEVL